MKKNGRARTPAAPSSDGRVARPARPHAPWPRVKLGEVCEEIRDRVQSAKVSVDCYVTTDNMLQNCAGVVLAEYVPKDVGLVRYQSGDVLLANIRPYLRKLWLSNRDGGCSSDVVVFRSVCQGLSPDYLFAALSQDRFFDYVMKKPRGTKMPRGDRDWMKQFEFPLPPLSVQREIVARLESELGAVDKLAKKFEELETAAEAEFKAELKETFGMLDNEKIQLCELEDAGKVILGRGKIISREDIAKCPGDNPVYSSSATGNGEIGRYGKFMFDDERITWSIDGGGRLFYRHGHRYSVTNVCGWLRVTDTSIHGDYLYYALTDAWSKIDFNYTHKAHPSVIRKEYFVAIPNVTIQHSIVARLDAAKAKKEALVAAAKRGKETAALWRKAILKEAFA